MPRIAPSIVVPVYRTPPVLLRRFLDSALGQTLQDLEIIAVDDAAPDLCPQILDETAAHDSRVTVIHRQTNGRAGAARNDGMERAQGEFALFADADDLLRPGMCEQLLALAKQHQADIVACSWAVADEDGRVVRTETLPDRVYELGDQQHKRSCLRNLTFAPWAKLFRRETLGNLRYEQFEANIGEDALFNVAALCRARRMVTTSYVGYEYTVHSGSVTGRSAKGMPYLRTLMKSNQRIHETLLTEDGSPTACRCADWLVLKRFGTGCGWIAGNPDPDERRTLWDFWCRYLQSDLLPLLNRRGALSAWCRFLAAYSRPSPAARLIRIGARCLLP